MTQEEHFLGGVGWGVVWGLGAPLGLDLQSGPNAPFGHVPPFALVRPGPARRPLVDRDRTCTIFHDPICILM